MGGVFLLGGRVVFKLIFYVVELIVDVFVERVYLFEYVWW